MRKITYRILIAIFLCIIIVPVYTKAQNIISVAGKWHFAIDPVNQGISQKWYNTTLSESVELPGSMLENKKGDPVSLQTQWTASIYDSSWYFNPRMAKYRNQKIPMFPFWLTPEYHYTGAAWYQKR
ncbi:hypothetical protein [Arachidicoccus ginsenosidivorans]|uniref:hypothetical protein n=1 Tax=Arachidicoccus ginsenosidivorans TaxID=496057 RepID=UPI001CEF93F0|nr:hypothetical protein [Arachidicoccus ginsenosidivorans]